jgi:hypothetical protein
MKQVGVTDPIVEVFSNDPRLSDLATFGEPVRAAV